MVSLLNFIHVQLLVLVFGRDLRKKIIFEDEFWFIYELASLGYNTNSTYAVHAVGRLLNHIYLGYYVLHYFKPPMVFLIGTARCSMTTCR